MVCRRKNSRRKSDQIVLTIMHDIKKIAPEMAIFINTDPKPYEDVKNAHDKVMRVLDSVMEKEYEMLKESRCLPDGENKDKNKS